MLFKVFLSSAMAITITISIQPESEHAAATVVEKGRDNIKSLANEVQFARCCLITEAFSEVCRKNRFEHFMICKTKPTSKGGCYSFVRPCKNSAYDPIKAPAAESQ